MQFKAAEKTGTKRNYCQCLSPYGVAIDVVNKNVTREIQNNLLCFERCNTNKYVTCL